MSIEPQQNRSTSFKNTSQLEIGTIIDRYQIESILGSGGMATVYRAKHVQLGTYHAMKVLTVATQSIRDRLVQEGRVQGQIHHINIVNVTDLVQVGNAPGLIMELIRGPSLEQHLSKARLSLEEANAIAQGVLSGVAAAHNFGLVHRDLKPGNIMLEQQKAGFIPKITDFGLAKIMSDVQGSGVSNTRSGVAMGSPPYMAPEQIRDAKSVDARADIFSLGAILYEMVTGRRAFHGRDMLDIFGKISEGRFVPPRQIAKDISPAMEQAIMGALVVDPAQRIQTCAELITTWNGGGEAARGSAINRSETVILPEYDATRETAPSGQVTLAELHIHHSELLSGNLGQAYREGCSTLHTTACSSLRNYNGVRTGDARADNITVAFSSPSDAVRWAVATSNAIEKIQWSPEVKAQEESQSGLSVSIGLHTEALKPNPRASGRPQYPSGAVDLTASFAQAGLPGDVIINKSTWLFARRDLPRGVIKGDDLGEHWFRGHEGATRVFRARLSSTPARRNAPIKSLQAQTNLEPDPPPFVDRPEALEEVDDAVLRGEKLVTLCGAGGIGKTRLATRFAGTHMDEFADEGGVWFVDVVGIDSIEKLVKQVTDTLGIRTSGRGASIVERVGVEIHKRGNILIILDGFDDMVPQFSMSVKRWLRKAPHACFLLTSRERLDVPIECAIDLDPMNTAEATELYITFAEENGKWTEVEAETEAFTQLIEYLAGLPLAIQLAVAWRGMLSVEQLNQRLTQGPEVLSENPRWSGPTLATVIEQSWSRLEQWQKEAAVQCAVFEGGFSLEAAEKVIDLTRHRNAPSAASAVGILRDKSLVQVYTPDDFPTIKRFKMSPSIKAYATQQLKRTGLQGTAYLHHSNWAIRMASPLCERAKRGEIEALDQLTIEYDNINIVRIRRGRSQPADAIRAALFLAPLLAIRGPYKQLVPMMSQAMEDSRRSGLEVRVISRCALAEALTSQGQGLLARTRLAEAEAVVEQGRDTDIWLLPIVLQHLCRADLMLGSPHIALSSAERAVEDAKRADRDLAKTTLGIIQAAIGQLEESSSTLDSALQGLSSGENPRAEACARVAAANTSRLMGDASDAHEHLDSAISFFESIDDLPNLSGAKLIQGLLFLDVDDKENAEKSLNHALELFQTTCNRHGELQALGAIGLLFTQKGQMRQAVERFAKTHKAFEEMGDSRQQAIFLAREAAVLIESGHTDWGRDKLKEASTLMSLVKDFRTHSAICGAQAALEADNGDLQAAEAFLDQASELREEVSDPIGDVLLAVYEAHLHIAQGELGTAVKTYWEAVGNKNVSGAGEHSLTIRLAARVLARQLQKARSK